METFTAARFSPPPAALFVRHRPLSRIELNRLADEYDDYHNANDGLRTTLAGGDNPKELGLSPGDRYSKLVYEASSDRYRWSHNNYVEAEPEGRNRETSYCWRDDHGDHERN